MVRKLFIMLAVCLATPALADDTIDISGLQSWGLDGDVTNETGIFYPGALDPELGYIILRIDYDITIQTFGSSWLSDLNIRFGNSDATFHGSWPDTFIPGAGANSGGTQRFTGSFFTDIHLNKDAEFHVELFESFDDVAGGPDAVLLPGSTLTFGRFIPAPGGATTLGLGLLAIGARRRR